MKRENKGITLIALVITVTVLIILASIATYSGVGIIRQSKLNKFTTEMKIMQTEVNDLYQKATSGETVEVNGSSYSGLDIYNIGKELDSRANSVFTSETSGITDKSGYRLYDQDIIQGLGIEGVEEEYFVNVEKRSIISCNGFEYEGTTYYTLDQLPSGLYNVEYSDRNTDKPTFDVTMEKLNDGTFRMTISNIQYNGYIDKWQVKYQKEGQVYWSTSEDLSFIVPDIGPYDVKIQNGDVVSNIKSTTKKLVRKWVSKIDGNGEEEFLDVKQTSDGGYIAVGYTTSTNISELTNKGSADCLISKYDANGNEQWKKSVGGSEYDWYSGVIELTNGIYIAVGTIFSTDVLNKNGTNIGHGYEFKAVGENYSINAMEGIIGTYDSNGNEISLKTTGKAYNNEVVGDVIADPSINIILSGIDKVSDGNYIVTGKRYAQETDMGKLNPYYVGQIAIKYDTNGREIASYNEDLYSSESYALGEFNPQNYKDAHFSIGILYGLIEDKDKNYIFYGADTSIAGGIALNKSDSNLQNFKDFGDARSLVKDCFLDGSYNYITLNYGNADSGGQFIRIEKQDNNGNMIWEYTDKVIKSISKSSENNFVGISDDNKFLKYNMDDGSVLEEYDVPTYENVYAIEGKEEFIFLGTPTDEEGITIEGTSGAVIAKYAIE